eukprot:CAMPEP_0181110316 /NCGR_PEP_ID=MMETSP1071-20121207/18654_1 /TAXON_ID=35127 /ORGANISM="Thalassiosira sp., Strain NH16" /LENGTH=115 /DNA_ID=CAMNT_0023194089 /DNA_START=116 /DNA_END=459 /DNA_ORIENTATION=+
MGNPVAAHRFSAFKTLPTPPLLLMMMIMMMTQQTVMVQAHFIFAKVVDTVNNDSNKDDQQKEVRVYFSEPVAMEGKGVSYLGGRVTQLGMIGPRNNVHNDEVEPTHPVIDLVDEG